MAFGQTQNDMDAQRIDPDMPDGEGQNADYTSRSNSIKNLEAALDSYRTVLQSTKVAELSKFQLNILFQKIDKKAQEANRLCDIVYGDMIVFGESDAQYMKSLNLLTYLGNYKKTVSKLLTE
jgi:hypothetical protein